MTTLLDLRFAMRWLGRNPGFAAMAILTLAFGIAASSAMFAVVHAVLFRDLPYPDVSRIVAVTRITAQSQQDNHAAADFIELGRESRSLQALAAYRNDVIDLSGGGQPERVASAEVTSHFFEVFGVPAAVGRTFASGAEDAARERVVVLGDALWRRRFGGDPAVVGRTIRVNREPCTIVGVMPASFRFPGDAQAWVLATRVVPAPPLTVEGDLLADRQVHYFNAVARLAPGTTLERARAELSSIAARLGERFPQTNRGQGFGAIPLKELVTSDTRAGLFILLGAVAFVLLVACANVASLLLARATGRRQELATRAALGAARAQLVRQLLVESLLVGVAGGCLGLLLASWGLDGLVALLPDDVPRLWEVRLDATVTVFTLALGAATALVFGILPALQASRTDLVAGLRAGELRAGGAGAHRALSALVVVEVVSGVVLCVGAGLMVNTLLRLERVDPGYRTEGVVRVPLPLPSTRYATGPQQGEFYGRVLEKLAANPLTRLSAAAFPLPLTNAGASGGVQVEGRPWSTDRERPVAAITWVSPGYFSVMGIPMRRGRDLDARDAKGTTPVAVISETMASRLWPGEDTIGRRFSFGDPNNHTWITVVGIVGDVRHEQLSSSPALMLYIPMTQDTLPFMSLAVRSDAGAGRVAQAVRAAVRQLDPELPVDDATEFSTAVARSLGGPRLRARLLSGFAAAALLLAAIGVYGLLSYSVARRRREIGIRLALGAAPAHVVRQMMAEGMRLALIGIVIGVPAALALSRLIASQLFGVAFGDPLTLVVVCVILLAVAMLACWLPARRVLAIDPVTALRAE